MTNPPSSILALCRESNSVRRRAFRKDLLAALRSSESPVIIDLSAFATLDHEDINLLLECTALAAGRDTQLFFVAGSPGVRLLLDVTRISSLVPVFESTERALAQQPPTKDSSHGSTQSLPGAHP